MDKLHHIALQVQDIGKALAWYRAHFDIQTIYEDGSWAMLRFANIDLALVVPGQHPAHVAIERDDAASFGPLVKHRDGTASVYFADPFGNVIEVLEKREPMQAAPPAAIEA